jgi:hypothetical protein
MQIEKLKYLVSLYVVFLVASPAVLAQESANSSQDEEAMLHKLASTYSCKGEGSLVVFGRYLQLNANSPVDHKISVNFVRNAFDNQTTETETDGRYCFRYKPGLKIIKLEFVDGIKSCIEQISGQRSHLVNKVSGGLCPDEVRSTLLDHKTSTEKYGAATSSIYYAVVVNPITNSGEIERVRSLDFLTELSLAGKGLVKIPSADPEDVLRVAVTALRRKSLVSVGPVGLITLSANASPDTALRVSRDSLRLNELIPPDFAIHKVVFVEKSRVPTEIAASPQKLQDFFSHVVILMEKMKSGGETTLSSDLSSPPGLSGRPFLAKGQPLYSSHAPALHH